MTMEGFEIMGVYDNRNPNADGYLTPRKPLLQESNEELFIQRNGSPSGYLKEPISATGTFTHEVTGPRDFLRQLYTAASYKGWLIEILALALALVALTAIIITLALHNGSPLPKWPFQISINALISVFGVILKGTMLVPVAEGIYTF
jgi:hypothetical protein